MLEMSVGGIQSIDPHAVGRHHQKDENGLVLMRRYLQPKAATGFEGYCGGRPAE
jgi:hypothetical protein